MTTTVLVADEQTLTRPSPLRALVRAVRPLQWVKNALVLAAPAAAGVLFSPDVLLATLGAAVSITAVASGCYLINDVQDRHLDRAHPVKRMRPVASGALPVRAALAAAAVLLAGGLLLAAAGSAALFAIVALYAALTLLYSAGLKSVPWLEMAIVASGFVLRAVAGAQAARVPASVWFLVVVSAAALLVVGSKRSSERLAVRSDPGAIRPVLRSYSNRALQRLRSACAYLLVLSYAGWVLEGPRGLAGVFAGLSAGPVIVVVGRWLRRTDDGGTEAPERVLFADRVILVGLVLWTVTFGASVLTASAR